MRGGTHHDSALVETIWYDYDLDGRVISRRAGIRRLGDSATLQGIRLEYDGPGRIWRAIGDTWEDPVEGWYERGPGQGAGWGHIGVTRDAMTWSEARTLANELNGKLGIVENEFDFDWYVDTFRPTDDQEARYWLDGRQVEDGWWSCNDLPWGCWEWVDYDDYGPEFGLFWVPEDYCGQAPDWCAVYGCLWGGYLAGEPDDSAPDCVENQQEDHLQFVFNFGDDPNSNGFADANSNSLRQALILIPSGEWPTFPTYERLWAMEFRYGESAAGGRTRAVRRPRREEQRARMRAAGRRACLDGLSGRRRTGREDRERYLVRKLDPDTMDPLDETWSDYDNDSVYGDFRAELNASYVKEGGQLLTLDTLLQASDSMLSLSPG